MKPDTRPPAAVRIKPEQYEEIARIATLTRKSISEVAATLITYGLKHSSIKPIHLYDLVFDDRREGE